MIMTGDMQRETAAQVLSFLRELGIDYRAIHHDSAASMEECAFISQQLGTPILKNLFLTTRRQGGLYLLVMRPDVPFAAGVISRQVGTSRLCFAGDAPLMEHLCTRPGSISPLGLMFDTSHQVTLLLDEALASRDTLAFHPCDNTCSLAMSTHDFLHTFLPATGHEPMWVNCNQL